VEDPVIPTRIQAHAEYPVTARSLLMAAPLLLGLAAPAWTSSALAETPEPVGTNAAADAGFGDLSKVTCARASANVYRCCDSSTGRCYYEFW